MAHKKNWKIINVDDFVIFKASDDIIEEANAKYAEAAEINRQYLETHPDVTPVMPITGTFICAQPPNYRGYPMLHATEEQWAEKFRLLKSFGVDTVIYQAANCLCCSSSCGRNDNYDMNELWDSDEDIRSLKSLILFGIRGIAAYAYHAFVLGYQAKDVNKFFYKALFAIGMKDWGAKVLSA